MSAPISTATALKRAGMPSAVPRSGHRRPLEVEVVRRVRNEVREETVGGERRCLGLEETAFAAAKLSSWQDRNAPRDLYDLWAMTGAGMVDAAAAALFARFGPFTHVTDRSFDLIPSEDEWERSLGHQGRIRVGPEEASRRVRDALDRLR
ncbi:hypothetical protein FVA74_06965 [Salinibacterium sp. dk2585]|uniref:nucleotidyl transferase AbiEii/AbiGii toxin family protein n=1 Tax=unclassified Salinibacterium TaxID=2632331 RepID=UPI0011C2429C|nr:MULTISPECIES: nucleotidyl transferase AbiEii/AbiGii toxin family protein [unclassified Salinibacterium]QEE61348.1 hypothetical protein FVA74_06965 [Salinibacterium sp. dk2585]TXK54025.1 hypothetical protein FVP63_08415 [Salinibacterium sp. dk5596]